MWFNKFKRKTFNKVPYFILGLLLILIFGIVSVFIAKNFISNHIFFISPLAQNKITKNASLEDILYKNNIQFSKVEIASDSSYIIFLKDQGVVDLDRQENLQSQISSLQLILSRLTIEGKKFKRLDLRFDKPIIEF